MPTSAPHLLPCFKRADVGIGPYEMYDKSQVGDRIVKGDQFPSGLQEIIVNIAKTIGANLAIFPLSYWRKICYVMYGRKSLVCPLCFLCAKGLILI